MNRALDELEKLLKSDIQFGKKKRGEEYERLESKVIDQFIYGQSCIGYKKLSRALIVLDAMIQQGWIVDKEGNRARRRPGR